MNKKTPTKLTLTQAFEMLEESAKASDRVNEEIVTYFQSNRSLARHFTREGKPISSAHLTNSIRLNQGVVSKVKKALTQKKKALLEQLEKEQQTQQGKQK